MQLDSKTLYYIFEYLEDLLALRERLDRYCKNKKTLWGGRPFPAWVQEPVDTAHAMIDEIDDLIRKRERAHSAAVLNSGRLD